MDDLREALVASMTELEQPSGEQQQETSTEEPSAPPTEGRDESGRFAPRVPAKDALLADKEPGQEAAQPVAQPTPQAQPAQGAVKPPVSWTPEAREEWGKLPQRAQQEIIRRENQINEGLRVTAEARQFQSQMQQLIKPYLPMIQAENATPVQAIDSLFRTAAILRTAPPQQRAQAVADMIIAHGIDVAALDGILSTRMQGGVPRPDPMQGILQQIDQRLRPVQDFMSTIQQKRQEQSQITQQQAQEALEQFFEDPAFEFARDVADDMADLLDMAAKRGQTLSLPDAYRRATLAHPTISKILERRMLENGAAQQSAAASRARQAAVSVSDSGAPSQGGDEDSGGDIRSALMASIKQVSNRR